MKLIVQKFEQTYLRSQNMKNSLQLELQLKIKRANRFLTAKLYTEAIKEYTEGLDLYQQNRTYNNCVSQQFQAILYSLRGNTYSLNLNAQSAQNDFEKSLNINPYSALTLSRRAKHFMKEKRFSQAIQDIDLALLYDPQNLSYLSLLNSIQNYVNQIKDSEEKAHVTTLINDVKNRLHAKPPTQSESEEQDCEQILNFSKLKQIDRKSVKLSPKLENRKSIIEFKEDQILEYIKDDDKKDDDKDEEPINILISSAEIEQKIKQQDEELEQLEAQQQQIRKTQPLKLIQHFVLTKTHQKSRKSILRSGSINNKGQSMLFLSTPGDKIGLQRKSSLSAASIKDIDGKLVKHQKENIKFRPSFSQVAKFDIGKHQQIPEQSEKQNFLSRTTPKLQKRKSCLRSSKKFEADQFEQLSKTMPVQRKSSGFLDIKNIDGKYHHKKEQSSEDEDAVDVKLQTSSDDDDNEYNIFGKKKQKQVVETIEYLEEIPEVVNLRLSKKKSILKKDSLIDSSLLGWKMEKKKSVLFKTG